MVYNLSVLHGLCCLSETLVAMALRVTVIPDCKTIEFSSSSTGLEGVNNVFSHVSLILVAIFSIFAKSLLTSFLALVHRTCAPMFLEQNTRVSEKQDACGT